MHAEPIVNLRTGSPGRAPARPPGRVQRRATRRRLRRLRGPLRERPRRRGGLLGACPAQVLRPACDRHVARLVRGADPDPGALRHRGEVVRSTAGRAQAGTPGASRAAARGHARLARHHAPSDIETLRSRDRHPLRGRALDGADPLRRGRHDRDRQPPRRARDPTNRARTEELAVRRIRRWRHARRRDRVTHRHRQAGR